jgi:hypothetical protein
MTRRLISETTEAANVQQRKIDAGPQRADFEREFGKDRIKDEKDGSWTLTLHERHEIRRAHEMQEGTRKIEVERGAEMQARMKRERVVRRDGKVVDFPEELVDTAKKQFRPAGRYGGAPSLRFGLSDAMGKYEQGPQGLWFVWNDGWEPTKMWEHQAKGDEQRDPDGNLWLKREGEWVLDSEEA